MDYTQHPIPNLASDETGFKVNGEHFAALRKGRAAGAAAGTFGVTVCAFAVTETGNALLTHALTHIEGEHTSSCAQTDLLTDGRLDQDKVDALINQAIEGALTAMLAKIAAEQAFAQLEV